MGTSCVTHVDFYGQHSEVRNLREQEKSEEMEFAEKRLSVLLFDFVSPGTLNYISLLVHHTQVHSGMS